jgi:hypothetical protein
MVAREMLADRGRNFDARSLRLLRFLDGLLIVGAFHYA